jgi:hypothetical protein
MIAKQMRKSQQQPEAALQELALAEGLQLLARIMI